MRPATERAIVGSPDIDEELTSERPNWLVRIIGLDGVVKGAGFLVDQSHILTCAHVVNQALSLSPDNADRPDEAISIDFPFLPSAARLSATVAHNGWIPTRVDDQGDIAVLELDRPTEVDAAPLADATSLRGHHFWAFGFPVGHDRGVWADGRLVGPIGGGWVQLESVRTTGHPVEAGFSGAPVWDTRIRAVVGMIVGKDRLPDIRTAFMAPTNVLASAWPALQISPTIVNPRQGSLSNVPPLPAHFVPRPNDLSLLKSMLLGSRDGSPSGSAPKIGLVGLSGMGGVGKSVLAAALAQDDEIREAFPDGIIWLELGLGIESITERQAQLASALGDNEQVFSDPQRGRAKLSELLADKSCLVVLDNVWRSKHLSAFDAVGPRCRMVFTTRDAELIRVAGARKYEVGLLEDNEAIDLLSQWSEQSPEELPEEAYAVIQRCAKLALGVAMAGAMVRGRPERWQHVLHRLQRADLGRIRADFPHYPYPNVLLAIKVSLEDLDATARALYYQLAVFKDRGPIPEAALKVLWLSDDIDNYDAEEYIDLFLDRSLARRDELNRIVLHDLQMDFICRDFSDEELIGLHSRLLESYSQLCPKGWPSGPADGYFFEQLGHHFLQAGRAREFCVLLLNFDWIRTKLSRCDFRLLIADYELINDAAVKLVQGALRLSAEVLAQDRTQLPGQLIGRLEGEDRPEIRSLLDQIGKWKGHMWLRPVSGSLDSPQGALLRTLRFPLGPVDALEVDKNSQQAILSTGDGVIRVWDLEAGTEVSAMRVHGVQSRIHTISLLPPHRQAACCADDGTVSVWDYNTGQELRTFYSAAGPFSHLCTAPNNGRAITSSGNNELKIWDLSRGTHLYSLFASARTVLSAVTISSDERWAVTGSFRGEIMLWELGPGRDARALGSTGSLVVSIAITPDGRRAVVGCLNGIITLWDLEEAKKIRRQRSDHGRIRTIVMMPDGQRFISMPEVGSPKVWEVDTLKELGTLKAYGKAVAALAVASDTGWIVSSSTDKMIRIWDIDRELIPAEARQTHTGAVNALAIIPNRQRFLTGSDDGVVKLWELVRGPTTRNLLRQSKGAVKNAAIAADDRRAITTAGDSIETWNLDSAISIDSHNVPNWGISASAYVTKNNGILVGSWSGRLRLYRLVRTSLIGREMQRTTDRTVALRQSAARPAGTRTDQTGHRQQARGRHVRTDPESGYPPVGEEVDVEEETFRKRVTLESLRQVFDTSAFEAAVSSIAVAPDGNIAICGSSDGSLKMFNLEKPSELAWLDGTGGAINAIAISPYANWFITGSDDGLIRVVDLVNWTITWTLDLNAPVNAVAISHDGKRVVSGSADGSLRLWSFPDWSQVAAFSGDSGMVSCAIWSDALLVCGEVAGGVHCLRVVGEVGGEGVTGQALT